MNRFIYVNIGLVAGFVVGYVGNYILVSSQLRRFRKFLTGIQEAATESFRVAPASEKSHKAKALFFVNAILSTFDKLRITRHL